MMFKTRYEFVKTFIFYFVKYSMNIGVQRMILSQKYDLGDCLGEGTFASVSEAVNKNTNKSVAIKQIFIQAHFIDQAVD